MNSTSSSREASPASKTYPSIHPSSDHYSISAFQPNLTTQSSRICSPFGFTRNMSDIPPSTQGPSTPSNYDQEFASEVPPQQGTSKQRSRKNRDRGNPPPRPDRRRSKARATYDDTTFHTTPSLSKNPNSKCHTGTDPDATSDVHAFRHTRDRSPSVPPRGRQRYTESSRASSNSAGRSYSPEPQPQHRSSRREQHRDYDMEQEDRPSRRIRTSNRDSERGPHGPHGDSPRRQYRSERPLNDSFDHRSHQQSSRREKKSHRSSMSPPRSSRRPSERKPVVNNHMLTLLIEDARFPGETLQLVEVVVPMRQSTVVEGSWVDAMHIGQALQKGPAKIDGPARGYAKRGQYKQIFIRVSADGESIYTSANLKVTSERTLQVFIEHIPVFAVPAPSIVRPITPASERMLISPLPTPLATLQAAGHSSDDDVNSDKNMADASQLPVSQKLHYSATSPSATHSSAHQLGQRGFNSTTGSPHGQNLSPSNSMSPTSAHRPSLHAPVQDISMFHENISAGDLPTSRSELISHQRPGEHLLAHSRSPSVSSRFENERLREAATPDSPEAEQPSVPRAGFFDYSSSLRTTSSNTMRAGPSPSPRQTARQPIDERSMPIHQEYPLSKGRAPTTTGSPFATSSLSTTSLGAFGGFSQFAQPQGFGLLSTARDGTNVPSRAKDPVAALATQSTEQREIDREIASYLRDLFKNETGWAEVEKSRAERTPLVKQLAHFRYMQDKFNQYVSKPAPSHLKLAANVPITKAQFLLAFNLPLAWGDDCTDALELTGLYGFGGSRCEDPEAITMLNEVPPITTTIQVGRYLKRLRALHQQWTENHPAN